MHPNDVNDFRRSSSTFIVNFEHISQLFQFSSADFEQVNINWNRS